tara:strand:- start:1417 stop:1956 length:540 start_codon:yes stop_codon:yes gene_type:complete
MFQNTFLVIDFEFTCWRGRPPRGMFQEILDIGISEVDTLKKEVVKTHRIIVKPENSSVSKFCTELTSITQKEVDDNGVTLSEAISKINNLYDLKNIKWGSWGKFDRTQMIKECKKKNIEFPFSADYKDLQKHFSKFIKNTRRLYGVENALKKIELEFKGNPHRADCDAFNTAIIYINTI